MLWDKFFNWYYFFPSSGKLSGFFTSFKRKIFQFKDWIYSLHLDRNPHSALVLVNAKKKCFVQMLFLSIDLFDDIPFSFSYEYNKVAFPYFPNFPVPPPCSSLLLLWYNFFPRKVSGILEKEKSLVWITMYRVYQGYHFFSRKLKKSSYYQGLLKEVIGTIFGNKIFLCFLPGKNPAFNSNTIFKWNENPWQQR